MEIFSVGLDLAELLTLPLLHPLLVHPPWQLDAPRPLARPLLFDVYGRP